MKEIPYSIASYKTIRQHNYYYVDKTPYIPLLEKMGRYLIFIRPRRFGKSSFLTLLETYYDVAYAEEFEALFGETFIYQHPTSEKHRYLILKLNFSEVDPDPDVVKESFAGHIDNQLFFFTEKYQEILGERCLSRLQTIPDIYQQLAFLIRFVGTIQQKMYIIIDEYDNFANTILASQGQAAYHDLMHGEGFLRYFFNLLKSATDKVESGIGRIFITGVSPVTLDDVTSGFNIGNNVSLDPALNEMLGFTSADVHTMLDYYRHHGKMTDEDVATIIPLMQTWYNQYRFAADAEPTLFNTTLVLYFMKDVVFSGTHPSDMIDSNVQIDYTKLRHLMVLDRRLNGNFRQLTHLLADQETPVMRVVQSFPVEYLTRSENFLSLLFYFGLVSYTPQGTLQIPNETMKHILYSYIRDGLADVHDFTVDIVHFADVVRTMAYEGAWQPVLELLANKVQQQTSIRDYLEGEKVIQTFLQTYLHLVGYYAISSEREVNKGYVDILLEPLWHKYVDMRYGYVIELKYLSRSDGGAERVQAVVQQAIPQVQRYLADSALIQRNQGATIRGIVVVFCGWELVAMEEVAKGEE